MNLFILEWINCYLLIEFTISQIWCLRIQFHELNALDYNLMNLSTYAKSGTGAMPNGPMLNLASNFY